MKNTFCIFLVILIANNCLSQQFLDFDLDTSLFKSDTIKLEKSIEITYRKKKSDEVFKIKYEKQSNSINFYDCYYFDGDFITVEGKYKDGAMIGKWIEYNNSDNTNRIIDYDFSTYKINEDSITFPSDLKDFEEKYCISSPKGGHLQLMTILNQNLFIPPSFRFFSNQNQIVKIEFIVLNDFKIANPKGINCFNNDLNKESIRLISLTNWTYGCARRKPISAKFIIPINFEKNNNYP